MLDRNSTALFSLDAGPAENANGKTHADMAGLIRKGGEAWPLTGRFQFGPETGRKYLDFETDAREDGKVYVGRLFRDESHRGRPQYKGYLHPRRRADASNTDSETDWVLEISAEYVGGSRTGPGAPIILGRAFPPGLAGRLSYDAILREANTPF